MPLFGIDVPQTGSEMNKGMNENRKKVFTLLDSITETDIQQYGIDLPSNFNLQKSIIEFKNLLNTGKILRGIDAHPLQHTQMAPILKYILNKLNITYTLDSFYGEQLSVFVGPGNVEDKIQEQNHHKEIPRMTQTVSDTITPKKKSLLEEITSVLSQDDVERIRLSVTEEYGFFHPTGFAEALEKETELKKTKLTSDLINDISGMDKPQIATNNERDTIEKIEMPNHDILKDYILQSVSMQMQYFADKRYSLGEKLINQNLTEQEIYNIVLSHKHSVDSMARESLDIGGFIDLLCGK